MPSNRRGRWKASKATAAHRGAAVIAMLTAWACTGMLKRISARAVPGCFSQPVVIACKCTRAYARALLVRTSGIRTYRGTSFEQKTHDDTCIMTVLELA